MYLLGVNSTREAMFRDGQRCPSGIRLTSMRDAPNILAAERMAE